MILAADSPEDAGGMREFISSDQNLAKPTSSRGPCSPAGDERQCTVATQRCPTGACGLRGLAGGGGCSVTARERDSKPAATAARPK